MSVLKFTCLEQGPTKQFELERGLFCFHHHYSETSFAHLMYLPMIHDKGGAPVDLTSGAVAVSSHSMVGRGTKSQILLLQKK